MKTISVVNTKGGTGKSTIATNLATALAQKGNKVLLIDTDGRQQSAMSFAQTRANLDENKDLAHITSVSVPYSTLFSDIPNYDNFDYVLIDAGAGDNEVIRSAIACAVYGMLLIPVQPSTYDVWATQDTLQLVKACRQYTPFKKAYVMLNRMPSSKVKMITDVKESLQELCNTFDIELLQTEFNDRVAFKEAICVGRNVNEYMEFEKEKSAKANSELQQLVAEIQEILKE